MKLLEFIGYYAIARCIYEVGFVLVKLALEKGDKKNDWLE